MSTVSISVRGLTYRKTECEKSSVVVETEYTSPTPFFKSLAEFRSESGLQLIKFAYSPKLFYLLDKETGVEYRNPDGAGWVDSRRNFLSKDVMSRASSYDIYVVVYESNFLHAYHTSIRICYSPKWHCIDFAYDNFGKTMVRGHQPGKFASGWTQKAVIQFGNSVDQDNSGMGLCVDNEPDRCFPYEGMLAFFTKTNYDFFLNNCNHYTEKVVSNFLRKGNNLAEIEAWQKFYKATFPERWPRTLLDMDWKNSLKKLFNKLEKSSSHLGKRLLHLFLGNMPIPSSDSIASNIDLKNN